MAKCPYRLQVKRHEPIVFAMHHHLTSGIGISGFAGVVVDELPLNAFIRQRTIPPAALTTDVMGPLKDLLMQMQAIAANKKSLSGKALMDVIGGTLTDVYSQIEVDANALPQLPMIYRPEDVAHVRWWYLMEFLDLAQAEHEAWRRGWPRWTERLRVSGAGLHLLSRNDLWDKLPTRALILDATGQPALYEKIFKKPVSTYAPNVARIGKVYQVAGRMNGKRAMSHKENLTAAGEEALQMVKQIIARFGYERAGVVCHKSTRAHFARMVGEDKTLHFGNMRGTNDLGNCDGVFVVGTHGPGLPDVIAIATALDDKRIEPFTEPDEDGNDRPLYRFVEREYRLTPEALSDWDGAGAVTRLVGEYADLALRAVHDQLREAELTQAIHRARINVRDADVWLISGVPLDEPVDGLFQDPPIAPEGIHWRVWAKLEPWLAERWQSGQSVTYDDLAGVVGVWRENSKQYRNERTSREKFVSVNYMRDHKWLQAIAGYMPEFWEVDRIKPKNISGGRPSLSLKRKRNN